MVSVHLWLVLLLAGSTRPPREAEPRAAPTPAPAADPAVDAPGIEPPYRPPSAAQGATYRARRPKSIVDAQLYREAFSAPLTLRDGRRGTGSLIDLAPATHAWFLATWTQGDGTSRTWHVENPAGRTQRVALAPDGLLLTRGEIPRWCDVWTDLESASRSGRLYAPICGGALAVRNGAIGHTTTLEWTADFLRDHVYFGEHLTTLVKRTLLADALRITSELSPSAAPAGPRTLAPPPARVAPSAVGRRLEPVDLALPVDSPRPELPVGEWAPVHAVPGAWVSALQPRYLHPEVLAANAPFTHALDPVEGAALVYTVAVDLAAFDLGYELGTDHPRVGWSERAPARMRDPTLPGPDGFATVDPLARTGMINPALVPRLTAVFVGGFKRSHSAFKDGRLAGQNAASHAGFVQFGTELSHLQPGLATVLVDVDGRVDLKTWTEADDRDLWRIRHARQNGVPLVAPDPDTGQVRPGELVGDWTGGNWSGSADGGRLRSVRSGLCLVESDHRRFLLYSYFSSATPSAMAHVFSAYGCRYGMLLDMNALEHTYLAFHVREGGELALRHLVAGMEEVDVTVRRKTWPRFVGYADNRDFFYLLRKEDR